MSGLNSPVNADNQTAENLILAGIDLFGEHGFSGTTTRMIATAAGANIGSIAYYFGNKHGLYLAAARHISTRLREDLQLGEMGITYDHAQTLGEDSARRLLEQLMGRMVHLFMERPEARRWLMLVMREQANPSEAFDILYRDAFEKAHVAVTTLVSVLMKRPASDQQVILEAHTLVGQVVFFLVGRTPLLRRLGAGEQFDPETIALAEAVVVSHVRRMTRT
ncbi:CerR family C-terminal domain-containing protein [Marinobacter sp. M1N3S26]|uniref:CerR family C-terminal domain-containing protein n=1 Tax=unclassified Marinobacter TaxID=83889 RepID=UPI00387B9DA0